MYLVVFVYLTSLFGYRWITHRPVVLSSAAVAAPTRFTSVNSAPDPNSVFELVNGHREAAGVDMLVPDAELTAVAEARARDMAQRKYYAHENPDKKHFGHLLTESQINAAYSCENLDLNFSLDSHPYVEDWMASTSGHRSCLLHPNVSRAGYAVAIWDEVSVLGTPQKAYIVVAIHASN